MKKEIIGLVFFINVCNASIAAANPHDMPGRAEDSFKTTSSEGLSSKVKATAVDIYPISETVNIQQLTKNSTSSLVSEILNSKRRFLIHVPDMAKITSGYKNKNQLFVGLLCNSKTFYTKWYQTKNDDLTRSLLLAFKNQKNEQKIKKNYFF